MGRLVWLGTLVGLIVAGWIGVVRHNHAAAFPLRKGGPVKMVRAVEKRYGSGVLVSGVDFNNAWAEFNVVHPDAGHGTDEYDWWGGATRLGAPRPAGTAEADRIFHLSDFDATRIVPLVEGAKTRFGEPHPKTEDVTISRDSSSDGAIRIEVTINGRYATHTLVADSSGNVLKVLS